MERIVVRYWTVICALCIGISLLFISCAENYPSIVKFKYHNGVLSAFTQHESLGKIDRVVICGLPKGTHFVSEYRVSLSEFTELLRSHKGVIIGDISENNALEVKGGELVYSAPLDPAMLPNYEFYAFGYTEERYRDMKKLE